LSKVLSGSSRRHFPGEGERAPAAAWCRRTGSGLAGRARHTAGDDAGDRPGPRGLAAGLARWRAPRTVHDPGKVIADLAAAVAPGGECLAGIAVLREQPELAGPVASDPVVSRLASQLAATCRGR
jgi:hypothetical protein